MRKKISDEDLIQILEDCRQMYYDNPKSIKHRSFMAERGLTSTTIVERSRSDPYMREIYDEILAIYKSRTIEGSQDNTLNANFSKWILQCMDNNNEKMLTRMEKHQIEKDKKDIELREKEIEIGFED